MKSTTKAFVRLSKQVLENLYNEERVIADNELSSYDRFTDIEFNPQKLLNCQAYVAADVEGSFPNAVLEP